MTAIPAGPGAGLEDRLARLETSRTLGDLVVRYCMAVDDRDLDGIVALFTADGSFGHHGSQPAAGPDELRRHYLERLADIPYSVHVVDTQLLTELGPDESAGVVNAHAEMGRLGQPPLRAAMRYHDRYRKVDGTWLFASRRIHFWYFAPEDEVVAGFTDGGRVRWPGAPRRADLPDLLPTWEGFLREAATDERGSRG